MGFALSEMKLSSTAFEPHGKVPTRHSGEGEDISPPLTWQNAPADTASYALICHDPDAPLIKAGSYGFVHWLLYGLAAETTGLEEGSDLGVMGHNDFGRNGYGGPKPPAGHGIHHYYFWILALDKDLNLDPGFELTNFLQKVEPHVLAMNRLVGTYRVD